MASQAAAQSKSAADPVQCDPAHYKVEFENDKVRVLRISYGPREKSEMHGHPALVAVLLTDHESRHTLPDGSTLEIKGSPGEVRYMDAMEHSPENLRDAPFELIAVELKG